MAMKMRGDKCCPGRGKWVKIPILPENIDKRSVNNLGTLQRVTTRWSFSCWIFTGSRHHAKQVDFINCVIFRTIACPASGVFPKGRQTIFCKGRPDYRSQMDVIVTVINIWWHLNVMDMVTWITTDIRSRVFSEKGQRFWENADIFGKIFHLFHLLKGLKMFFQSPAISQKMDSSKNQLKQAGFIEE